MKLLFSVLVALSLVAIPLAAQQQPDPATLNKILANMQAQRNQAMDAAAMQAARADMLAEELAKVKDELTKSKPVPTEGGIK